MIKTYLKRHILFLIFSLVFLGTLVVTDFVWNKNILKIGSFAMWAVNVTLFVLYTKKARQIAKQCETCGLFVPLGPDNGPKPHCCYMKPKGI